jgi:hypothetical protein
MKAITMRAMGPKNRPRANHNQKDLAFLIAMPDTKNANPRRMPK